MSATESALVDRVGQLSGSEVSRGGHREGDEDSVVVVGLAMIRCCFSFEGTPGGVLEVGLGLRDDLAPPLDVTVGRRGRIEYVEIDPTRCLVVRVGDNSGVHEFVVRGGETFKVSSVVLRFFNDLLRLFL